MNSALYEGHVRHRRFTPPERAFSYRLFMAYLDLDELPEIFAGSPLWSIERPNAVTFRRSDYFGDPARPLDECIRALVRTRLGLDLPGPVRMLTNLRYLGYCFNPVSFYYCYDAANRPAALVAEVTNTPWNERHAYVHAMALDLRAGGTAEMSFSKQFHVSPFLPMDMAYRWHCTAPGARLLVHMENFRAEQRQFDATLAMTTRHEFSAPATYRLPLRRPFITVKIAVAIYWQALCLWLRRAPVFAHPQVQQETPP